MEMAINEDRGIELIASAEEVAEIVARLAEEIRADYKDKRPVLLGVLKGSFIFTADLVRELKIPCEADFLPARSYGKRDDPSSKVDISIEGGFDVAGRDVIVVEDIVDRGETLKKILSVLKERGAASIKTCALLIREGSETKTDYTGRVIDEGFVVGYGLDYKELQRNLDGLYVVKGK